MAVAIAVCRCCSSLLIIFSNLFTGSRFQNVSNIKLFPLLISFSSFQAHSTFVIPSPYSSTRSSDLVTLLRPPVQSRLRITNYSFRHTAPQLWNKLPHSLRVPYQSGSSLSSSLSSGSNPEPAVNLSHGTSMFKTYLFSKSFPP